MMTNIITINNHQQFASTSSIDTNINHQHKKIWNSMQINKYKYIFVISFFFFNWHIKYHIPCKVIGESVKLVPCVMSVIIYSATAISRETRNDIHVWKIIRYSIFVAISGFFKLIRRYHCKYLRLKSFWQSELWGLKLSVRAQNFVKFQALLTCILLYI